MAEIAKRAGVHVTTVSLALRNHPSLPEATRERLRKLAESMGYKPDPGLRALMNYRRNLRQRREVQTLAYVTNWDSRWVWKEFPAHVQFFEGASQRAQELGYALEHFWLGEPLLSERRLGDILYARGIAGVVLASQRFDKDGPLDFDWTRFAAVKIDYFPHEPQLHIVTNDQRSILRLATRQVLAAGYKRVGLVSHRLRQLPEPLAGGLRQARVVTQGERDRRHMDAGTLRDLCHGNVSLHLGATAPVVPPRSIGSSTVHNNEERPT